MPNGTAENEYMHESIEKDAVKFDLDTDQIIAALCYDNDELQAEITKLKRHISSLLLIADKAETDELEDVDVELAKDAVNSMDKRIYTEETMAAMVRERDAFCKQNLKNGRKVRQLQTENENLKAFAQFVLSSITEAHDGYVLNNLPENLKNAAEKALGVDK